MIQFWVNFPPFLASLRGLKDVDLRELSGGGLTGAVESSKLAGGSYEDKMNAAPVAAAAPIANGGGGMVEWTGAMGGGGTGDVGRLGGLLETTCGWWGTVDS